MKERKVRDQTPHRGNKAFPIPGLMGQGMQRRKMILAHLF
jgi:hypothetical protein